MMSKRLTKRLAIFSSFSSSKQEGKDFDQLVNQDGGEKIAPKAACGIKRARRLIRLLNPESFIIVPFGSFQLIKTSRFDIIIQSYCRPLFIEWTIEYRSSLSSPCLFNSVIWRSLRRHRHSFIIIPSTFNRKCRHESKGKWKKKTGESYRTHRHACVKHRQSKEMDSSEAVLNPNLSSHQSASMHQMSF